MRACERGTSVKLYSPCKATKNLVFAWYLNAYACSMLMHAFTDVRSEAQSTVLFIGISDLVNFIPVSNRWNSSHYFLTSRNKHRYIIFFTLWAFRRILFEKIWSSSFGDITHHNLLRENPHTKYMRVGVYGKYIAKNGTTNIAIVSTVVRWQMISSRQIDAS